MSRAVRARPWPSLSFTSVTIAASGRSLDFIRAPATMWTVAVACSDSLGFGGRDGNATCATPAAAARTAVSNTGTCNARARQW